MRSLIAVVILGIFICAGCTKSIEESQISGDYYGEEVPSNVAKIFAPGIVSTNQTVRDLAISKDGNIIVYSLRVTNKFYLVELVRRNGIWSKPEFASFSGEYKDLEPFFSPIDNKLYFVSNRPLEKGGEEKDFDVWFTERAGDKWGDPVNLGEPINTEGNEFYPSMTTDGTIYYTAAYKDAIGGEDIYLSRLVDGKYQKPENLGLKVNSKKGEYNSFIAPDGSYLLYNTEGRGKGMGSGDLWVSFKNDMGEFQEPVNMGEKVNTEYFEFCPSLSPDGKYLFFTSTKTTANVQKKSFSEISSILNSPDNGSHNIYWISSSIISELKQ